jgi:hypothetical protein
MELGCSARRRDVVREIGKSGIIWEISNHDDMDDCHPHATRIEGALRCPSSCDPWTARARFLQVRAQASDPDALNEAQHILIESGAISYCIDQLLRRHEAARCALRDIRLVHPDKMEAVLDGLVAPVWRLFEASGNPIPQSIVTDL